MPNAECQMLNAECQMPNAESRHLRRAWPRKVGRRNDENVPSRGFYLSGLAGFLAN